MNVDKIQQKLGVLILGLAAIALLSTLWDRLAFHGKAVSDLLSDLSVQMNLFVLVVFGFLTFLRSKYTRWTMAFLIFLLSGPIIISSGSESYFGLGFIVVGTLTFQRFGMLEKHFLIKAAAILVWTFVFIFVSDRLAPSMSIGKSISAFFFILVNLVVLYILFEEEIRDLLAANRSKDAELAEQAAEIARLEPLSVLGERVAHVAHSFKNNLNQVSTALFLLEQANAPQLAAERLHTFNRTMSERIENILMVSRAGADLEPEVFDAARLLEGLRHVYLTEPAFLQRAKAEVSLPEPTLVRSVRWDFILLIENILKNALEAITERGVYGTIRIELADRRLTIANDGGAMAVCSDCHHSCLECPRYGRPGRTSKKGGSGHGLAQVFGACRRNGWNLRIRTSGDWTIFEILLLQPQPKNHHSSEFFDSLSLTAKE